MMEKKVSSAVVGDDASVADGIAVAEVQSTQDGDVTLKFLEASGTSTRELVLHKAATRNLVRKIDWLLLPIMAMTELLQFLDKTTLSYAALFGIQKDAALHGSDYSWLSSIFYFGYLISQPFTGFALQRYPPAKCLAVCVFLWSVILFMHAACINFGVLWRTFPAFMLITNAWYPRKAQSFRMGCWFSCNGIAQIVGGILAYGLGHIQSAIESWKWMFLVTGALTMIWSVVIWFALPNSMIDAYFLSEDERRAGIEMIRANNTGVHGRKFKREQLIECLTDIKTWMFFITTFLINIPNSVASFGTLVQEGFGNTALETTLLAMPAGAWEFVIVLVVTWACSRFQNARTWSILVSVMIALLGGLLLFYLPRSDRAGLLIGYYILYSYPVANLLLFATITANTAGHTKKITTNAIIIIGYAVGNISAPQFYKSSQAPTYRLGIGSLVVSLCLCFVSYSFMMSYLMWLNKKREPTRLASADTAVENIEFMDLTRRILYSFTSTKLHKTYSASARGSN